MTHEIYNAMVARRRELRDNDASAYQGVRLVVQRQGVDTAVCSLVVTRVGNGRLAETRLAFATISIRDEDGSIVAPSIALERALGRLRSKA